MEMRSCGTFENVLHNFTIYQQHIHLPSADMWGRRRTFPAEVHLFPRAVCPALLQFLQPLQPPLCLLRLLRPDCLFVWFRAECLAVVFFFFFYFLHWGQQNNKNLCELSGGV